MKIGTEVMKKVIRARWMRARCGASATMAAAAGKGAVELLAQRCEELDPEQGPVCAGDAWRIWAARAVRAAASGELARAAAAVAAWETNLPRAEEVGGDYWRLDNLMMAIAGAARGVIMRTWDPVAFADAEAAWYTAVRWRRDAAGGVVELDDTPITIRGGGKGAADEVDALELLARGACPTGEEASYDLPF